MNWLKKVMAGRYGGDQLCIALLILSVLLSLISEIPRLGLVLYLSFIPLALSIFRMFSKNINKRSMENYKFSILISPIYSWSNKRIRRLQDSKTHKYFSCPNCKTQLRVPKGKGKISISCPKCKTEFVKKT